MSVDRVMDGLAVKLTADLAAADPVTGLPGIVACYGPNTSNTAGVKEYPSTLGDTPAAYVEDDGSAFSAGTKEEDLLDLIVRFVVATTDPRYATRVLIPLYERTKVAMRTGYKVPGSQYVQVTGHGPIEDETDLETPLLTMPVFMQALTEEHVHTYSPT